MGVDLPRTFGGAWQAKSASYCQWERFMDLLELLQANVKSSHEWFAATVADVTQEVADWPPAGQAHPIGERMAHLVASEDWLIQSQAKGGTPLYESTWAGRVGFGDINFGGDADWARSFKVDPDRARDYMRAVFQQTDEYIAALKPADLDRTFDMSEQGMGQVPFPVWVSIFIVGHIHDIAGEISVLKGLQGLKGYPA